MKKKIAKNHILKTFKKKTDNEPPLTLYELALAIGAIATILALAIVITLKMFFSKRKPNFSREFDDTESHRLLKEPEDIQQNIKIDDDELVFKKKIGRG